VDAASGVQIGPDYPDGTGTPDGVASEIRERCRKTFAHRIYQFFWTNGTLEYARKVWSKLSKKDGVREVRILESSEEGKEMEKNAQSAVNKTLREKINKQLAKIDKLKNDLEQYQKDISRNYANKATVNCFLVRFRRFDKNGIMKSGEYSIIEDNVLKAKKLAFHLFVQIGNVE